MAGSDLQSALADASDEGFTKDKKKPAPKKAAPKKSDGLTKQENQVLSQMSSDISKEGKASAKQLKSLAEQIAVDQAKEDNLTGMAHPDAKALVAAGVPASRVAQLSAAHAPSHPAAQPANPNAGVAPTDTPTDPAQYAADVLQQADLPNTASNEKLLEDQMTVEGMPGSENNPLATSLPEPGSSGINSDNVQEYPNLYEGASAEAKTLEQNNMASIYNSLKSGTATPQQYAAGLASSSYEGSDPSANAGYANSFLTDAGQPTTTFPSGGAAGGASSGGSTLGTDALQQAMGTNIFSGLSSVIPSLGTQSSNNSLQSALAGLGSAQSTLTANTSQAPGSPDQPNSVAEQTNVNPAASYQAQLAAMLGNKLQAGTAGKTNA